MPEARVLLLPVTWQPVYHERVPIFTMRISIVQGKNPIVLRDPHIPRKMTISIFPGKCEIRLYSHENGSFMEPDSRMKSRPRNSSLHIVRNMGPAQVPHFPTTPDSRGELESGDIQLSCVSWSRLGHVTWRCHNDA